MNALRVAVSPADAAGLARLTASHPAAYPSRLLEGLSTQGPPELREAVAPESDPSTLTLDKVHRHLHRTVQDHPAAEFCPECRTARLLLGAFVVMTATVLWAVWEWVQHDTLMNLVSRL